MIKDILAWWWQQMRDLLPAAWISFATARDTIIVAPAGIVAPGAGAAAAGPPPLPALRVALRRRDRETDLGSVAPDRPDPPALAERLRRRSSPAPVVLRLPPGLVLERDVVLPLAAERERDRVLGYEMDRLTPFASDAVFWASTVTGRDRARGRLKLRLNLLPKADVQPLLAALAHAGLAPSAIEAPGSDGSRRLIGLGRQAGREDLWRQRMLHGAAIACLVLALAAAALPFVQLWQATAAVEARIAALQPQVLRAEALRRHIAGEASGANVIAAAEARLGDALQAIAAITEILPDDTYLTNLALRQRKLGIDGRSTAAARLIAALSDDPAIRNPTFAAPITRDDQGHDLFSIRAELAP